MAVRIKVDPINRDIELMLDQSFSPKAQAAAFAGFAREQIEEAKSTNKSILGRVPRYTVSVDGRIGGALEQVKPDGVIVAEFELFNDVLVWIADQLVMHSPVKTGRYQKSHTLFADQKEVPTGGFIPLATQYVFVSTLPYSRKIELGSSSQAPDGVYQAVASLARRRFGNIARIEFTYRGLIGLSSGTGTLVNPLWDPTKRNKKGQGTKAYNKSEVRLPVIVVDIGKR